MHRNDYGTTTGSASSSQITITARSLRNLSEASAEIERLEKEVARWRDIADATEALKQQYALQRDAAWNDAIEAVAELSSGFWLGVDAGTGELDGTYCSVDPKNGSEHYVRAAAIRALKRSQP